MTEGSRARRCEIWGVLNVTPDSFSDGGDCESVEAAVAKGARLLAEGAHVIDVGGASSRPAGAAYGAGAAAVTVDEELGRVVPVIDRLVRAHAARVSIDTVKPEVARAALEAGARIVNDVSGGGSDGLLEAAARAGAQLVLMHTRGDGSVAPPHTSYASVVDEVISELSASAARAHAHGIPTDHVWVDPGLGFAKTAEQSVLLLASLPRLLGLGYRVLVGASRKSFIAALERAVGAASSGPAQRLGGSCAAAAIAAYLGAHAVRAHDVAQSRQAVIVARALAAALPEAPAC